jgi:hypothetical protein
MGSVFFAAVVLGFIVGFFIMEMYILFIWKKVERYSEEIPKMGARVSSENFICNYF